MPRYVFKTDFPKPYINKNGNAYVAAPIYELSKLNFWLKRQDKNPVIINKKLSLSGKVYVSISITDKTIKIQAKNK